MEGWKWTSLPSMTGERDYHSCGRAGRFIVVVGGCCKAESKTTSEIFSLDSLTWTTGPGVPPIPDGKFYSSSVNQLEDTFYLLGGYGANTLVYEFDPEFFTWKLREERLETARRSHALVSIPNKLLGA